MPANFFNGRWYEHGPWTCAVSGMWFQRSTFDLFKGIHVPSKEWARRAGFPVQDGKWLPVIPSAPVVTGKLKPKRVKPPRLFEEPPDLPAGTSEEDWSA